MRSAPRSFHRRPGLELLEPRMLLDAAANELFVRFRPGESAMAQQVELTRIGAKVLETFPDGPELLGLGSGDPLAMAIGRLQADPNVLYASPDSMIHVESTPYYPTDPGFAQSWGLNNSNNIDIDSPEAYGVTVGTPSTIVAVIDSGIDLSNPDFAGKIWTNPGNDASGGFPNDIHGWNFLSHTANVQDDNGHGTHVSAIIAAQGSNGFGVVGVDPSATMMPLKFLDQNGNGTTDAAVSAIYFAVNHGARVINASWGGVAYDGPLDDAIAYANAHNVVFVTAAGNDGTNNDAVPSYPASFRQPNEISVAAIDRNGALPSYTNYGATTVDLAAPGVDIISDVPTSIVPSGQELLSGTSMSAAYVSGVAALVAGLNPNFSAAQIVQRIDSTVKLLPSLAGRTISGGMVDAFNAITGTTPTVWVRPGPVAGIPSFAPGQATEAQVHAVILASDEFFFDHGSSASGFVTGLYESALGRAPDPAGLANFVWAYNLGMTTRYQMALEFLTLPEGRETEVARWYQIDLSRSAFLATLKADPGVDSWSNTLVQGWAGDQAVEAAILASPEYLRELGASPGPVIQGYFEDLDGRLPGNLELANYSNALWQGITPFAVVRYFQTTQEVRNTRLATWFLFDLGRPATLDALKNDPGVQGLAAEMNSA